MKSLLFSLLLILTPAFAAPVELIPGLLSYDVPEFFYRLTPPGDPGDDPFSGQSRPIELGELGNSPERLRQLNISIRAVGFAIGNGKRVTRTPLSFDDLKKEMEQRIHYGESSKPEETLFAGQKALHVTSTTQRGALPAFYKDVIWVPLTPNSVLEIDPTATSPELLQTIVTSFKTMKLIPK
jgi:hypothetical protein